MMLVTFQASSTASTASLQNHKVPISFLRHLRADAMSSIRFSDNMGTWPLTLKVRSSYPNKHKQAALAGLLVICL